MNAAILHVVGARPNFMKCAPVFAALANRKVEQLVLHTGQHYDRAMSSLFFEDLNLRRPDVNLGIGSGSHAQQTAGVMSAIEEPLVDLSPSLVLVYGDINSTLAAALVAQKLGITIGHVEAGLRSFDDSMPEEVNRRLTDQLANFLFVTSPEGVANLKKEGVDKDTIFFVGNPMIDSLLLHKASFDRKDICGEMGVEPPFVLVTVHRPTNVDVRKNAKRLVEGLKEVSEIANVILPLHPRGREELLSVGLGRDERLRVVDPLGYIEFMSLMQRAAAVITDSGGVQEESTVLGVPCLTVRKNTERPVTISQGTNELVEPEEMGMKVRSLIESGGTRWAGGYSLPALWDGRAGERIADVIESWVKV